MKDKKLEVKNLTFAYRQDKKVLENINFEVVSGEILAIIGQNGSGKSTLLKNLIGLLEPDRGTIKINGKNTEGLNISDLSREVGFVLQNPDMQLFAQTVEEEVAFGLKNLGYEKELLEQKITEALETVGLREKRKEFPPALSHGDRTKVVIASVLAMDPDIIILDEPTLGQDHTGTCQLMNILTRLNREGKTVILVTHDMSLVARYVDRVMVLNKGKIILQGGPREVFSQPDVILQSHIKPPLSNRLGKKLQQELNIDKEVLTIKELGEIIIERTLRRKVQ